MNASSWPPLCNHPLVEAIRTDQLEMLRCLIDREVTFEPGSELDTELSTHANVPDNAEINTTLEAVQRGWIQTRARCRHIESIPTSISEDRVSIVAMNTQLSIDDFGGVFMCDIEDQISLHSVS